MEKFECDSCGTISTGRFFGRNWPTCDSCDSDTVFQVTEGRALTLLSTVVAPTFSEGRLEITPIHGEENVRSMLERVNRNLCGHPVTTAVLKAACPSLPEQERAFWDGVQNGLAIRPKGGVRASKAEGDTPVATLDDLEVVMVKWVPLRKFAVCGQINDVGGSFVAIGEFQAEAWNEAAIEKAHDIAETAGTEPEITNAWVYEIGKNGEYVRRQDDPSKLWIENLF